MFMPEPRFEPKTSSFTPRHKQAYISLSVSIHLSIYLLYVSIFLYLSISFSIPLSLAQTVNYKALAILQRNPVFNPPSSSECSAQGQIFTACTGTQDAVLPEARLPPQAQVPRLQFYQGMNRCSSFPLHSSSHSLFSI